MQLYGITWTCVVPTIAPLVAVIVAQPGVSEAV
jgi:hypothetical protein